MRDRMIPSVSQLALVVVAFVVLLIWGTQACRATDARIILGGTYGQSKGGAVTGTVKGAFLAFYTTTKIPRTELTGFAFIGSLGPLDLTASELSLKFRPVTSGPLTVSGGRFRATAEFPQALGDGLNPVGIDEGWLANIGLDWPREKIIGAPELKFRYASSVKEPSKAVTKGLCGRWFLFGLCLNWIKGRGGQSGSSAALSVFLPTGWEQQSESLACEDGRTEHLARCLEIQMAPGAGALSEAQAAAACLKMWCDGRGGE